MGSILIPVLRRSDHCRTDICIAILRKIYSFYNSATGRCLMYNAASEWFEIGQPWHISYVEKEYLSSLVRDYVLELVRCGPWMKTGSVLIC
jgi:hypothetical protein